MLLIGFFSDYRKNKTREKIYWPGIKKMQVSNRSIPFTF